MIRAFVLCIFASTAFIASANEPDRVVYRIDNAEVQATKALRNARNQLDVAPDTKIVVVTHAEGVGSLFEGAKVKKNPNIEYAALASSLKARGVLF